MTALKLKAFPSKLLAIVDRVSDARIALHAGYSKVIIIAENQEPGLFLTEKHNIIDCFHSLLEDIFLRNQDRDAVTGAINNTISVDNSDVVRSFP